MSRDETVLTGVALTAGMSSALLLIFANLSAAYLVKLFAEGRLPPDALFVVAVTVVDGVVAWALKRWLRRDAVVERPRQAVRHDRAGAQARRREAKAALLELARRDGFTVQEAMALTGFDRAESEYLLDELLASRALQLAQEGDVLVYRVTE